MQLYFSSLRFGTVVDGIDNGDDIERMVPRHMTLALSGLVARNLIYTLHYAWNKAHRRASSMQKLCSAWLWVNDECCDDVYVNEKKTLEWERGKDPDEKGVPSFCASFPIDSMNMDATSDCKHILHPFDAHSYGPAAHVDKIRWIFWNYKKLNIISQKGGSTQWSPMCLSCKACVRLFLTRLCDYIDAHLHWKTMNLLPLDDHRTETIAFS